MRPQSAKHPAPPRRQIAVVHPGNTAADWSMGLVAALFTLLAVFSLHPPR